MQQPCLFCRTIKRDTPADFIHKQPSPRAWGRCSGSLPHGGAVNGTDEDRLVSECIDHLKTADAADIEMGGLFLCEVEAFTGESTDAGEMNVTSCHRKVVTITHAIFLEYLFHYLSPVS